MCWCGCEWCFRSELFVAFLMRKFFCNCWSLRKLLGSSQQPEVSTFGSAHGDDNWSSLCRLSRTFQAFIYELLKAFSTLRNFNFKLWSWEPPKMQIRMACPNNFLTKCSRNEDSKLLYIWLEIVYWHKKKSFVSLIFTQTSFSHSLRLIFQPHNPKKKPRS